MNNKKTDEADPDVINRIDIPPRPHREPEPKTIIEMFFSLARQGVSKMTGLQVTIVVIWLFIAYLISMYIERIN